MARYRATGRAGVAAGVIVVVLTSLAGLSGCLETETALAPVEKATVDAKLVGDWKTTDGEGNSTLTVRNFNGREYYIEDRATDGRTVRYAGHVADVKGATFLHVRELSDDGAVAKKHVLLRLDRPRDGQVKLRQLNADFFADKPHDTTPLLRAIIEQNLDNAAMYDGEPLELTRMGP